MNATIEDNGVGFLVDDVFSPSRKHKRSLGLISMKERLTLIGGDLKVISRPGRGTKIIARLEKE